jgi:hypothetical protein
MRPRAWIDLFDLFVTHRRTSEAGRFDEAGSGGIQGRGERLQRISLSRVQFMPQGVASTLLEKPANES